MKKYSLFFIGLFLSFLSINAQNGSDQINPSNFNHQLFEKLIFEKVNEYRVANGCKPLKYDTIIYKVAKDHNDFLKNKTQLTHDQPTPGKRTIQERLLHYLDVEKYSIGENIARTFVLIPTYNYDKKGKTAISTAKTYNEAATYMLNTWMQSKYHNENILNKKYTLGSIAAYFNPKDKSLTAVQVFANI